VLVDISFGVLAAVGIEAWLGNGIGWFTILFGVLAAIAPDTDFIIHGLKRGWRIDHFAHEHRDILHYPLYFSVLGGALISLLSLKLGFVWLVATLFHFVHDTLEGGWGIKWLYPLWDKYICLKLDSPRPRIIMNKQEQWEIASRHGDTDWLKNRFRLRLKLGIEVLVLIVSLLIVLFAKKII